MGILLSIGAIQALFFAIILFNKKNKQLPDWILTCWLLLLFVHIGINYLQSEGYYAKFPHLHGITSSFAWLYGPLLYFYVDSYIEEHPHWKHSYLLHFIPFVLYNVWLMPFYLMPAAEKMAYYNEILKQDTPVFWMIISIAKALSGPIYLVYCFYLIRRSREKMNSYFTDLETIRLPWLRYLLISVAVIWILYFSSSVLKLIFGYAGNQQMDQVVFLGAAVWIFAVGYYGLRQAPIFASVPEGMSSPPSATESIKYEKTKLPSKKLIRYHEQLLQCMEQEKPYLKPQLTIQELADYIDLPAYQVSQIINEKCQQSFFDFINQYRVEATKKAMADPKNSHLSLLGIALDSGFSSKASFNRVFKKMTGRTPSDYYREIEFKQG